MFDELLKVVRILRRRCPWDRKQTPNSVRPLLLNEVYELNEALSNGKRKAIVEELGDYLFVGLFLARILEEKKGIKLKDVLRATVKKLRERHPHIYGAVRVRNADEVLRNWERIKNKQGRGSILAGVPRTLPALQQAQLIQERCKRVGFDWQGPDEVLLKVAEEMEELKKEMDKPRTGNKRPRARIGEELGDLLFAVVNLCRHLNVDAEAALKDANRKFSQRFGQVEKVFARQGRELSAVPLAEMEAVWQQTKKGKRR
jgi:MazG family protein